MRRHPPSRSLALFLPDWPTDRLRREEATRVPTREAPLVTVAREGGRRIVASADAAARRLGLRAGMTLAHAQALVPGVAAVEAAPERDGDGLVRIARWALARYTPLVAVDPPDGLRLEIAGCGHLFGGEAALVADLLATLGRAGIGARAAVAGSYGAAHALARHAPRLPVPPVPAGGEAAALAPLPLSALRLDAATLSGLARLGFERIGEVAELPRAPLARRFGPDLLRRLDQALGRLAEPMDALAEPPALVAGARFAEPVAGLDPLREAVRRLCAGLCRRLAASGLGARRLDLLFHRVDGSRAGIRVGTAAPSRDPEHLARLFRDHFEAVDAGFGIEAMTLAALRADPLGAVPAASLVEEADTVEAGALAGLVDRLANRFGAARLYRVAPVESDVPERCVRRIAPLAPAGGASWEEGGQRPARLFARPEPVETLALLPDRPPVLFVWRGRRHRIVRADGPERIFGEWWTRAAEQDAVRDYFVVEDEAGARFWLYRSGDGADPATGPQRWFLHGVF